MGVRGVAGEKNPSVHEAVGHGALPRPEVLVLDRISDVAAQAPPHQCVDVGPVQPILGEIDELKAPKVFSIDDREHRPGALGTDEDITERFTFVVLGIEVGNSQIDRHCPVNQRLAAHLYAEQIAHRAGNPLAADEILRPHGFSPAALFVG